MEAEVNESGGTAHAVTLGGAVGHWKNRNEDIHRNLQTDCHDLIGRREFDRRTWTTTPMESSQNDKACQVPLVSL